MKKIRQLILALGLATFLSVPAFAADRIILTDGREFIGTITHKTENVVQIKVKHGGLEQTLTFWMGDVAEITDAADSDAEEQAAAKKSESGDADATDKAAVGVAQPKILLLPLTGTVGIEFRREEIEKVVKRADEIKGETGVAPIIVLEIESGGGLVIEMYEIHKTLADVKKRHRIVAWIKEAISAACATSLHCDEIYFRTEGAAGAMTAFAGGKSWEGYRLERWLEDASRWAEQGGRDGKIARAMIDEAFELSYDVDPVSGKVTFYQDLRGEFILSRDDQNLTFNSSNALHCGFADGIADTKEELAKLLDLPEWVEVDDQYGRKIHSEWIGLIEQGREEIPKLWRRLELVRSGPDDPLVKIGREIQILERLIKWHDWAPNLVKYEIGIPPKEELERMIQALRKQASDIRRARGGGG